MLSRWKIDTAPTPKDPQRRVLLVKGALKDVHSLIRRFGAMCGRPKKERGDSPFNYRLYLHSATAQNIRELEAELAAMGGQKFGEAARANGAAQTPIAAVTAPVELAPVEIPPVQDVPRPAPVESPAVKPVLELMPDPAAQSQGGSVSGLGEVEPPTAESLRTTGLDPDGNLSLTVPTEQKSEPLPASPSPAPAVSPAPRPAGCDPWGDLATAPLSGAAMPVNTGLSLDKFQVVGSNRFAHAAAMSVISDPGQMHNPLYICGPASSGKSHMLHGIAAELNKQDPEGPVLMTTGSRFARGIEAALAHQRLQEIAFYSSKAKGLIIDDLHLLGVTQENRQGLCEIIAMFLSEEKQIVLSSVYPQNFLGGLDEALQFRFHAGHNVEMKDPNEKSQQKVVLDLLARIGFEVDPQSNAAFVSGMIRTFYYLDTTAARLVTLRAVRESLRQITTLADAEPLLLALPAPAVASAEQLKVRLMSAQRPPSGHLPAILFFPVGHETHAQWVWQQLYQTALANGWPFPFQEPQQRPYPLEPAGAAPFFVSGECLKEHPQAVLVLGPAPGSGLAEHSRDFRYALEHLLKDVNIGFGWIDFDQVTESRAFAGPYLDMGRFAFGGAGS